MSDVLESKMNELISVNEEMLAVLQSLDSKGSFGVAADIAHLASSYTNSTPKTFEFSAESGGQSYGSGFGFGIPASELSGSKGSAGPSRGELIARYERDAANHPMRGGLRDAVNRYQEKNESSGAKSLGNPENGPVGEALAGANQKYQDRQAERLDRIKNYVQESEGGSGEGGESGGTLNFNAAGALRKAGALASAGSRFAGATNGSGTVSSGAGSTGKALGVVGAVIGAVEFTKENWQKASGNGQITSGVGALNRIQSDSQDYMSNAKMSYAFTPAGWIHMGVDAVARSGVGMGVK